MENMIAELLTKLKQIRKDREITQQELSKMSGVSYSTLTKLESGIIKNPSFAVIFRITRALDIRLDDLFQN